VILGLLYVAKIYAYTMNKLVEHMEKHHAPLMTAYESTRPETVMKETGWTREESDEGDRVDQGGDVQDGHGSLGRRPPKRNNSNRPTMDTGGAPSRGPEPNRGLLAGLEEAVPKKLRH